MNLVAAHSRNAGVELRGDEHGLRALAARIAVVAEPLTISIDPPPGMSPGPYDVFLTKLRIERSAGPLRIAVLGETLSVSGGEDALRNLAHAVELPAVNGGHIHIEANPGDAFIDATSEPLVIALRSESST